MRLAGDGHHLGYVVVVIRARGGRMACDIGGRRLPTESRYRIGCRAFLGPLLFRAILKVKNAKKWSNDHNSIILDGQIAITPLDLMFATVARRSARQPRRAGSRIPRTYHAIPALKARHEAAISRNEQSCAL
jgi:hypothetical protein